MTIGEVSKKFNITSDTLRYYEKIGLIDTVSKINGKRDYNEENIDRINFIICMKNAGFQLEKISEFLSLHKKGNKTLNSRLNMLLVQKEKLIKELKEKEETLNYINYKINLYKQNIREEKL